MDIVYYGLMVGTLIVVREYVMGFVQTQCIYKMCKYLYVILYTLIEI